MPGLDQDAIKLVLTGEIDTAQTWSTAIWLATTPSGAPSSVNLLAFLTGINTMTNAWWTAIKPFNAAACGFTATQAYFYPAHTTVSTVVADNRGGANPGTGATGLQSPRTCLVATTLTPNSGRSFRGRNYIPATALTLGADLQASAAACTAFATAHAALLTALGAHSDPVYTTSIPVVASFKLGVTTGITQIRCDSLVDVQRRREDKLNPSSVQFHAV